MNFLSSSDVSDAPLSSFPPPPDFLCANAHVRSTKELPVYDTLNKMCSSVPSGTTCGEVYLTSEMTLFVLER
jgi:hypothetical protein